MAGEITSHVLFCALEKAVYKHWFLAYILFYIITGFKNQVFWIKLTEKAYLYSLTVILTSTCKGAVMLQDVFDAVCIPAFAIGADLDYTTVRHLTKGDYVLVEMNGTRLLSTQPNPMASDSRWTVISNTSGKLTLRHTSIRHDLILPYSSLINEQPAVFLIRDKHFHHGRAYVVLQMISHALPYGSVADEFPPFFDSQCLMESIDRKEIIRSLMNALGSFQSDGWEYKSVCRFALRSNVKARIINGFRKGEWELAETQPDDVLLRIAKEIAWLPYLLDQNNYTGDAARLPKVTD